MNFVFESPFPRRSKLHVHTTQLVLAHGMSRLQNVRQKKQIKGKVSQFAPYGAGVTSYFKFLKFCSWTFLVVSAAVVPHLFINSNGDGITVTTNTDKMSWTTVGNLGTGSNYTTVRVTTVYISHV